MNEVPQFDPDKLRRVIERQDRKYARQAGKLAKHVVHLAERGKVDRELRARISPLRIIPIRDIDEEVFQKVNEQLAEQGVSVIRKPYSAEDAQRMTIHVEDQPLPEAEDSGPEQ